MPTRADDSPWSSHEQANPGPRQCCRRIRPGRCCGRRGPVQGRRGRRQRARGRARSLAGASHEMREALEQPPGLNKRRMMPLAFTSEKLAQQSGDPEATGEIQNGPNQESYDQRALPRTVILAAQQQRAARAAKRLAAKAKTANGQHVLNDSLAQAVPSSWASVGPTSGYVVPEATYTGNPAYVSGRTTSLATSGACTAGSCTVYAGTAGGGLWKSPTRWPPRRPGRRSAPTCRLTRSARSRSALTAASGSARANPTAPPTPRPGSACSSRPTAATRSARSPPT